MMNELEIFKDIVQDLTGASVWLMALYVTTKAMVVGGWVFLGNKLIDAVVSILKADISKEEEKIIREGIAKLEREIEDVKAESRREVESVKHKYKILKEAKEHESK